MDMSEATDQPVQSDQSPNFHNLNEIDDTMTSKDSAEPLLSEEDDALLHEQLTSIADATEEDLSLTSFSVTSGQTGYWYSTLN